MSRTGESNDPTRPPRSRFGPALWLVLAGLLLALVAVTIRLVPMMRAARESSAIGDGVNVETYGFDLTGSIVPVGEIVTAGLAKGALPAMNLPALLTPAAVDSINKAERGKYIVPSDRVIGVAIGGAARAYPLHVLAWHEIVNDTLGGIPIAATYNPLCDGAVVFDRRLGGEALRFAVSGLLYNSNLLMYDEREGGAGESHWSQIGRRALAGPAAGTELVVIGCDLVRWDEWRALHPATKTIARDPHRVKAYKKKPYANYFSSDMLRFPVSPLPEDELPRKTPAVVVGVEGRWKEFPFPVVAARANESGEWRTEFHGAPLLFIYSDDPPTVRVLSERPDVTLRNFYSFHFARHAMSETLGE